MPASDLQELLSRFAVALGIGLLIGLERGWRTREMQSGSRTAGVRTFAVSGLLGAVAAALSQASGIGAGFVLGASFAAFAAVMIVFCREENKASGKFSATTAIAAILTFSLGAFALMGDMRVAAAAAVATAGILASREDIHSWVHRARIAVGARPSGHDIHCFASCARRPDRTVWRRESARNMADCHRARRGFVSWLSRRAHARD